MCDFTGIQSHVSKPSLQQLVPNFYFKIFMKNELVESKVELPENNVDDADQDYHFDAQVKTGNYFCLKLMPIPNLPELFNKIRDSISNGEYDDLAETIDKIFDGFLSLYLCEISTETYHYSNDLRNSKFYRGTISINFVSATEMTSRFQDFYEGLMKDDPRLLFTANYQTVMKQCNSR